MKDGLATYIDKEGLHKPHEKILLAASGGLDSTVLAHLFKTLHLPFALAHMNYQLRGDESDRDAAFVEALGKQLEAKVFTHVAPIDKANLEGESVQMAARRLRYAWLEKLAQEQGYQRIATAHQADDNAETILLHITRGTGIQGLHGILPKRDQWIRPLLFATRESITTYAQQHHIAYREDASNQSDAYQRNHIRHHVIPQLQQINPSFISTMHRNIEWWRHAETLFAEQLARYRKQLMLPRQRELFIPLRKLMTYPQPAALLGALLQAYGFNATQLQQLLEDSTQPGSRVESKRHRLYKRDRFLILTPLNTPDSTWVEVSSKSKQTISLPNGTISMRIRPWQKGQTIPKEAKTALLDAATIKWPLVIRKWQKGDYFYPFGLTRKNSSKAGKKKLSDFFTDLKLTPTEKEAVWIITAGNHIIWVAPLRIDDRHKIKNATKEVLEMTYQPIT